MNRAERDDLVRRIRAADEAMGEPGLSTRENVIRRERLLALLAEYADRLPRPVLSICPFTGERYLRTFDPFGLDGPYWDARCMVPFDEPRASPCFQVLLGACDLKGRTPAEVDEQVVPGPSVPFVVPELLALPGMVAVIGRLSFASGDVGYPIAYFSDQPIAPESLHQEWGRLDYWFKRSDGRDAAWLVSTAEWDFELAPWIEKGKVLWIEPDLDAAGQPLVLRRANDPDSPACPFVNLPGERAPQQIEGGERDLLPLPDGTPIDPFNE